MQTRGCCCLFPSVSGFTSSVEAQQTPSVMLSVYIEANKEAGLPSHTAAQHNGIERHNAVQVKQSAEAFKLLPIPLTNLMERL